MLRGHDGREFHAILDGETMGSSLPVGQPRLEEVELSTIHQALALHNGSISAAARQLGIHRSTIYRRLKQAE